STVHQRMSPMTSSYRLREWPPQSRYWTSTSKWPAAQNAWPASRALSAREQASVSEGSAEVVMSKLLRKLPTNARRTSYSSKRLGEETRSEPTTAVLVG